MCGFVGFCSSSDPLGKDSSIQIINKMSETLTHRGPDSYGFWQSSNKKLVFGFRRLAIQDVSQKGNQPMHSESGQYVIVFNGEIYNHLLLRKEIESAYLNYNWKSNSDTETLLACFEQWGIEESIKKCSGMFSFAVWCNKNKLLTLGRDRLGEKPLYYGWQGTGKNAIFFFGSELKAFHKHPGFKKEINRNAISSFLRHGYIPSPSSIYVDIYKLFPAHLARVSFSSKKINLTKYWTPEINQNKEYESFSSDIEARDSLETVLQSAVQEQMISDVPI